MKRKLIATLVGTALLSMAANVAVGQTAKPAAAKPAVAKAVAVSGDKVIIGVMNDMSGLYADIAGPGSVEAAKMAVADFGGKFWASPSISSPPITRTSLT